MCAFQIKKKQSYFQTNIPKQNKFDISILF